MEQSYRMKTLFRSFPLGAWMSGETREGDKWGVGRRWRSKYGAVLMATLHYLQTQRCNLREMNSWILNIGSDLYACLNC